ncbi:MAG: fibronectin type III domain-containing protein, partial [Candidatus Omnitrophota bacterium]|nr:fibronectin type III domain-containing protein [Candidatus Omnitrophota bacterium]
MDKIKSSILIMLFLTFAFSCPLFAGTPQGVKETNIRNNQFTISWITVVNEVGAINYGTTPSLGNTQQDDKGTIVSTDTHHVTVKSLTPNALYYYDIVSGGVTYDNGGAHFMVATGPVLDPPVGSDFAYGRVYLPDSSPANGAVVYLNLSDNNGIGTSGTSQDASASVDSSGWWNYNLVNLRTPDLSAYFSYSPTGDNEILTAKKGMNDSVAQIIDTASDTPAPAMTLGWVLNMTDMEWRQKETYSSAASCEMILDYIRGGLASDLSQADIYSHSHPEPDLKEMTADEVDLALGFFDPYDAIVSNWADYYDSLPDGNPYQGYNYTVDTYDPAQLDAMNEYMRDIAHWMAYTVTREDWWRDGELVQRPNTPAAIPIFGDTLGYNHWVVVKGVAT